MHLNVDTSWYVRYRSTTNPDFGATYPQAITITNRPTIPATDADLKDPNHIQAIANSAAFHFAAIEQGGTSLYAAMSQKVEHPKVLEITLGIGGDEIAHFLEWVDFAGNAVQGPPFNFQSSTTPVTDNGSDVPRLQHHSTQPATAAQPDLPRPLRVHQRQLPHCAVIRPITDPVGGAMAAVAGLTASGLFTGQSKKFFKTLQALAAAADAATR